MVVSNTSPIMGLAAIGHLEILRDLYGEIAVPEAVREELLTTPPPPVVQAVRACAWVRTLGVADRQFAVSLRGGLHSGESEAIVLAMEQRSEVLLIDERRGRSVASALGVRCVGVLDILAEAKRKGLIPALRPLLDALGACRVIKSNDTNGLCTS